MRLLKYIAIFLLICNIPTFLAFTVGTTVGGNINLISFVLILAYAILRKKVIFLPLLIVLGLSYFLISGLQFYNGDVSVYNGRFFKYMVLVVAGVTLAHDLTKKELLVFLLIGSSTVIINSLFFQDGYGRYSGIYMDPNAAGYVCLTGFALTYGLEKSKLKFLWQFLFTFAGIITFSRTFILSWVLINLVSIKLNPKNFRVLAVGVGGILFLILTAQFLNVNSIRYKQLLNLVGEEQTHVRDINEDSRTETWATFYNYVLDKPTFGNGYGSFQTDGLNKVGPHNTFLMILGEAGIIVIIIFIWIYAKLVRNCLFKFRKEPHLLMMALVQILFLMTNHNYFTAYYLIFISLWIIVESERNVYEN